MRSSVVVWLAILALVASCTSSARAPRKKDYARALGEGENALELVTDRSEYPDFRAMYGDSDSILRALRESRGWFDKPSSKRHYPVAGFTHDRVAYSLDRLIEIVASAQSPEELSGLIALNFDVYRSVGWDGSGEVLFTAYYQPIFDGSRQPTAAFSEPLYGLPADLVKAEDGTPLGRRVGETLVAYPTRREIETTNLLKGQGLELVYLKNRLDAFIIHVQGSAKIRLPDDTFVHVGYAGKTDRGYTSIGQELVADGHIADDDLSLSAIREFFSRRPDLLDDYLQRNDSYVFFTETGPGGPYGSLGLPVTSYRTIATDKTIFPRGAPCAVATRMPKLSPGGSDRVEDFVALVCDQDTGGAIRSPGRCDVFVGTGEAAERVAGHTKYEGRLFYLMAKERP
ncbi:MAG: MltA domain-containing protein [Planctomycetes bacterium]|nr:MltA domain-containing protein [Planctomycetota bacterium]